MLVQICVGFLLAALVSIFAWKLGLLSRGGAMAACGLGTVVFGLGGLRSAVILLAFFISSSGLSIMFRQMKSGVVEKFSKGSTRDAAQVLANGGLAGLIIIIATFFPNSIMPWLGFCAALAAATADTWATEIGVLSTRPPSRISDGRPANRGDSGSVSSLGFMAAFAGSLLIAGLGVVLWPSSSRPDTMQQLFFWGLIITLAGFLGSLVDSCLGATIQVIYWCSYCGKETERAPTHHCGTETQRIRGVLWIQNDVVNAFCTASAVIFSFAIFALVG